MSDASTTLEPVSAVAPESALASMRARLRAVPRTLYAFLAVWVIELFVVQAVTLVPPHSRAGYARVSEGTGRLLLDVAFCLGLSLVLGRGALALLQVVLLPVVIGLTIYKAYFHQALSVLTVINQGGEGARVSDAGFALLSPWHGALLVALALKLLLLLRAPSRRDLRLGGLILAGYAVAVLTLSTVAKPLRKIATWESVSGLGVLYGYTPAWIAELIFFDAELLKSRALARAASTPKSKLTAIEAPIPRRDRVLLLQIESLDFALHEFSVSGRPVTPFLNRLSREARFYAVRAEKRTGSSDADFAALMGKLPSTDVATYKIRGYPFAQSVIAPLTARGFRTQAVHGVSGEFFNRRPAYVEMGFSDLIFREEFQARGLVDGSRWAVSDGDLFTLARAEQRGISGKLLQLVITATSHIPFHDLSDDMKTFFPGSHVTAENYLDAIAYVDREIERFVTSLDAETTVVIYGDHTSQVASERVGYQQKVRDGIGLVPLYIHDTSEKLAPSQSAATRAHALDGTYTLLDGLSYVHAQMLN
ncbi:MAG: LTA synthase family protein [Polyangiales bacterium]